MKPHAVPQQTSLQGNDLILISYDEIEFNLEDIHNQNNIPICYQANLMNNIEAAQKLEDQIMSVMNTAVEGKMSHLKGQ